MNNKDREELLTLIASLSQRYPEWRLGQLLANIAGWADQEIWDVEDEQLLEAAGTHISQGFNQTEDCNGRSPLPLNIKT